IRETGAGYIGGRNAGRRYGGLPHAGDILIGGGGCGGKGHYRLLSIDEAHTGFLPSQGEAFGGGRCAVAGSPAWRTEGGKRLRRAEGVIIIYSANRRSWPTSAWSRPSR